MVLVWINRSIGSQFQWSSPTHLSSDIESNGRHVRYPESPATRSQLSRDRTSTSTPASAINRPKSCTWVARGCLLLTMIDLTASVAVWRLRPCQQPSEATKNKNPYSINRLWIWISKTVPSLAALATRRLARGDFEVLRLVHRRTDNRRKMGGDFIPGGELARCWLLVSGSNLVAKRTSSQ